MGLIALVALVGAPYYWLLVDNRPGDAAPPPVRIEDLRRLAGAIPGPVPRSIAVRTVGWRRLPGTLFVAGGGLKRNLIGIESFVLAGPWGEIAIDSGLGPDDAKAMGLERFLPGEQAEVDRSLRRARLILFTHEHRDHLGGLVRLPDFARVAPRALLTPEQTPAAPLAATLAWPNNAKAAIRPFRYRGLAPVAPGVVLIRTPGHTPGSQMIYVRRADGHEFLFAGDTATMARSWQQLRARSRLVGDLIVHEDRAAVFGWLKMIRALKRRNPDLTIVAGHDPEDLAATAKHHGIQFRLGPQETPTAERGRAGAEGVVSGQSLG